VLRELFSKEIDASLEVSDAILEIRRVRRGVSDKVLQDAMRGECYEVRQVEGDNANFIIRSESHTTGLDLVYNGVHRLLHDPRIFTPVS
jgi:hypothetical protein